MRKAIILVAMIAILTACQPSDEAASSAIPSETTIVAPHITPTLLIQPTGTSSPTVQPSLTPTRGVPTSTSTSVPPTHIPAPTQLAITPGLIAFAGGGGDINVGLIRADGTGLTSVIEGFDFCSSVSWSPDGHKLAFTAGSVMGNSNISIYITSLNGSGAKNVSFLTRNPADVAWSPDGQSIAYAESGVYDDPSSEIKLVNVKDGIIFQLTPPVGGLSPAWSPDGREIAFLKMRSWSGYGAKITWYLMTMNADGSNERRVTDFAAAKGRISWSPNGQRIAFTSSEDCGTIHTVGVYGSDQRQLTFSSYCASNPSWSPDGKYIAFEATNPMSTSTFRKIMVMQADGSNITEIYSADTAFSMRPEWMPISMLNIGQSYEVSVAGAGAEIRSKPSTLSPVLSSLKVGDVVTIIDGPVDAASNYWWQVRTADGIKGWVVARYGWYQPVTP